MSVDAARDRDLLAAVVAVDVAAVEVALAAGADANAVLVEGDDHTPALVIAARQGAWNLVRLLLEHGADLEARSFTARTSLFDEDTTYRDDRGAAIDVAIDRGHVEVIELLLQHGADEQRALLRALSVPRVARLVLDRGASPDGPHLARCITNFSLRTGNLVGVQLLLEFGADPNQPGEGKKTVLLTAIEYGRVEEARALLAAGAKPPSLPDVEQAVHDAWLRSEQHFRVRARATARKLGFDVGPAPPEPTD